jgi:hypothetical protein
MNRWGIPEWLEREVKERDQKCIYCGIIMLKVAPSDGVRRTLATWEHINNDIKVITRENIARCCASCNSSKGAKSLSTWLGSRYCIKNGISKETMADVAKRALETNA